MPFIGLSFSLNIRFFVFVFPSSQVLFSGKRSLFVEGIELITRIGLALCGIGCVIVCLGWFVKSPGMWILPFIFLSLVMFAVENARCSDLAKPVWLFVLPYTIGLILIVLQLQGVLPLSAFYTSLLCVTMLGLLVFRLTDWQSPDWKIESLVWVLLVAPLIATHVLCALRSDALAASATGTIRAAQSSLLVALAGWYPVLTLWLGTALWQAATALVQFWQHRWDDWPASPPLPAPLANGCVDARGVNLQQPFPTGIKTRDG